MENNDGLSCLWIIGRIDFITPTIHYLLNPEFLLNVRIAQNPSLNYQLL
ncbi:MAG: hypothetical protein ACQETL_03785 [Bacteroidota bacterium]